MASSKRIGFYWGEEKVTLVEFAKNTPLKVVSVPLASKTNPASPFNTNLTDEIQVTAILQKMLKDNRIAGGSFYVSLPLKEIILRSFNIPFVKREDLNNAVKFEAKKFLPLDIQDLTSAFYTIPFKEETVKRLQVIFFAIRTESLEKYKRVFKQVNIDISFGEPCVVSLAKVLLFKKEITPTDHLAFLILDKNFGRICFINQGIPQFIREFPINSQPSLEGTPDSVEVINLRIVNEVGNSLDFYSRQFNGDKIEQVLVSSDEVGQELFDALGSELRLKFRKASPVVTMGEVGQGNDMDTIFAMGACVEPPLATLSGFNFLEDKTPKSQVTDKIIDTLVSYKEVIFVFLICAISLVGVYVFLQLQLKVAQQQYDQVSSRLGASLNESVDTIQSDLQDSTDKLASYKKIRTKSEMVLILLRIASHLPHGALLKTLNVNYDPSDLTDAHVTVDMNGEVFKEDSNEEIKVVNQIFSDFKNDKSLAQFVKNVTVSLNLQESGGRQVTGFNIHCS